MPCVFRGIGYSHVETGLQFSDLRLPTAPCVIIAAIRRRATCDSKHDIRVLVFQRSAAGSNNNEPRPGISPGRLQEEARGPLR